MVRLEVRHVVNNDEIALIRSEKAENAMPAHRINNVNIEKRHKK